MKKKVYNTFYLSTNPVLLALLLFLRFGKLANSQGEGGCTCPLPGPEAPAPAPALALSANLVQGDGVCTCLTPSPAPTKELGPEDFQDIKLFQVYPVIQRFKAIITSDPQNITDTWVGPDICNVYKGFFCDGPPYNRSATAVASIDFNGFLLAAPSISDFLVGFPDLALFHANSNRFAGTIPAGVANLSFLYELDVSNNLLSGSFPSAVLNLPQISFLDIRYNFFSGAVPDRLFTSYANIDVLFINNNNFMQTLPNTLGSLKASYLTLANNKFTGPIPGSLCNISTTLIEVLLLNNELTGCLPYEIGLLTLATVFDAGSNKLTGPIPYSFGCMTKLEQLNLAGNRLYGPVPEVVCALANLQNLSLSDNYFTHLGPICMQLIKKGLLDDSKNCILGRPNQRPIKECAAFAFQKSLCHFPTQYYIIPCAHSHSEGPTPVAQSATPSRSYGALHRYRTPPAPLIYKSPPHSYQSNVVDRSL